MKKWLGHYGNLARDHWKEHRPNMYRELKKKGLLEKALLHAQEQTSEKMSNLIEKGMKEYEAWELVKEQYVLLPSEEDQPNLAVNMPPEASGTMEGNQ